MLNNLMTYFTYETYSENICLYMKSKQPPITEKCICLTILSVILVYNFSEMHQSHSLKLVSAIFLKLKIHQV